MSELNIFEEIRKEREESKKRNDLYYRQLLEKDPFSLPFYLFHGTDAKIVRLGRDGRAAFIAACNRVIDTLLPYFSRVDHKDNPSLTQLLKTIGAMALTEEERRRYDVIYSDIQGIIGSKSGDPQYQYGNFYLAKHWIDAAGYAHRALEGGELGRFANSIILGAEVLGIGTGGISDDITLVKGLAAQPAEPVLFCFRHLDLTKLRSSGGGPVDWGKLGTTYFRYLGDVDLDLDHAAFLDSDDFDEQAAFKNEQVY